MATKINFLNGKGFENAVLLTGLPGIGLVGKIVVDYLIKELKPKKVGEIISDSFPPSVHTTKGVLELIKDEIYFYELKGQKFLFLSGPIQPALDAKSSSGKEHYEFAGKIVSEMKAKGVSQIITLAGINIGEKRVSKAPGVVAAATHKDVLQEWISLGADSNKGEGLISGAAGLILGMAKVHGLKGACLMGETSIRLVYGDPGAAKTVLELLNKKFRFPVDMDKIKKESVEIEQAFTELTKKLEKATEQEDNDELSYVR
ncbi:MAG: PAC2 family protein [Candidatus Diapherotrites archaeon]